MAKELYVVEIIPHECYFGLPCEPEITATVDKITMRWGFPVKSEQVFDTCNRDLFKCVSECNNYFAQNKVERKRIQWPAFCCYIQDYKE